MSWTNPMVLLLFKHKEKPFHLILRDWAQHADVHKQLELEPKYCIWYWQLSSASHIAHKLSLETLVHKVVDDGSSALCSILLQRLMKSYKLLKLLTGRTGITGIGYWKPQTCKRAERLNKVKVSCKYIKLRLYRKV